MTTSLDWLANENVLFTKSAITSECHNTFWWNKKTAIWINDLLKQCNVTFLNFNILTITVTQLLPKMKNGQNWSKIGPEAKMPFSPFLRIIFGVFVETSLKTVHTFLMGHILKFPAKKNFFCRLGSGVQKQHKVGQNCIFVKIIYTYLLGHFPYITFK